MQKICPSWNDVGSFIVIIFAAELIQMVEFKFCRILDHWLPFSNPQVSNRRVDMGIEMKTDVNPNEM